MVAAGDSGTRMFSARLPDPLYAALKYYAFFTDRSMNEVVVEAVAAFLEANGPGERIDALIEQTKQRYRHDRLPGPGSSP